MLVELSKMEQRYDAVMGVIRDGHSVAEVAAAYGVSRQSVHSWLARYEAGGLPALAHRSHRPAHSPHQMPTAVEALVLELRRLHPGWVTATLRHHLGRRGVTELPSLLAIHGALRRHGLIDAQERRKRLPTPNAGSGPVHTAVAGRLGGRGAARRRHECRVLPGVDDDSRCCR